MERYPTLSEARKREWFLKCTPQGARCRQSLVFLSRDGGRRPSHRTAMRYLDELEKEGKIEQVGKIGHAVTYHLK